MLGPFKRKLAYGNKKQGSILRHPVASRTGDLFLPINLIAPCHEN
jgi:hypothetical protein